MDGDGVIGLADAQAGLAANLEPRRTGTEPMARLAPGKQLAEVDILVELDSAGAVAGPYNRRPYFLRAEFERDYIADIERLAMFGGDPARRHVADADQLLTAFTD